MKAVFFLVQGLVLSLASLYGNHSYSEYWQELTWTTWQKGPFQLVTFGRVETEDQFVKVRNYQISEQFSHQVTKDFSWEVHYRYLHSKNVVADSPWRWQHRVELEANPTFSAFCNSSIQARNRLEIRRIEHESQIRYRFRQRTMWVLPLSNCQRLKDFSIYNEIFYDISRNRFQQNRFCPCMFTFLINKKVDLDLYFFVRSFIHEDKWRRSYVVGTNLSF